MTPAQLLQKARIALASAKLLQSAGDVDGACNRAYYAMFDAAKAALLKQDSSGQMHSIKTHGGLIVDDALPPCGNGTAIHACRTILSASDVSIPPEMELPHYQADETEHEMFMASYPNQRM